MERTINDLLDMGYSLLEIAGMSKNEMFENVMSYEGYSIGCQLQIKNLIKNIYGINLEEVEK